MNIKEIMEEIAPDVMLDVAIDYVDDQLAQLSEEERYSETGDVLRYILSQLQR